MGPGMEGCRRQSERSEDRGLPSPGTPVFNIKSLFFYFFCPIIKNFTTWHTSCYISSVQKVQIIYIKRGIIMNDFSVFNSLLDDFLGGSKPAMYIANCANPRVDIMENNDAYTLEMELPGRSENDINIELDHNDLTISSKNEEKEKKDDKDGKYLLKERRCAEFKRKFNLPMDVDTQEISASFKNGVLTVNMMKKPVAAPTKIAIEAC